MGKTDCLSHKIIIISVFLNLITISDRFLVVLNKFIVTVLEDIAFLELHMVKFKTRRCGLIKIVSSFRPSSPCLLLAMKTLRDGNIVLVAGYVSASVIFLPTQMVVAAS